ncbi:MAG TPA: XkdF-like putative serine protease domain-containing protein [Burkholderiaceae bacterium]|jgi:phage head maturation protease|nr:XkdF-like putative serine protease domain-containing protein [Burkholderiaceae bacterium]
MKQYLEITKVDAEQRMVYGYASTDAIDSQGEIVSKAAIEGAWDDYMKFANIREMHGNSAAGIVKEHAFDDKGVFIGAKIVDDQAWAKVVEGVYKGFSIGGKKLKDGFDAVTKTITKMKLTEISLVDRPANPEALIHVFKFDGDVDGDDADSVLTKMLASPEFHAALAGAVAKVTQVQGSVPDQQSDIEKMVDELNSLRKSYADISAEYAALQKRFDKTPADPKALGNLRVIEKLQDADPLLSGVQEIAPIFKNDGSIDQAATDIKRVFAGGGRALGAKSL